MPRVIDLHEDFIDVKGHADSSVTSVQAAGVNRTEFYAPQPNCFAADRDASFSKKVFDISVAQVEAVVEPNSVGNDIWRKSMALEDNRAPILSVLSF